MTESEKIKQHIRVMEFNDYECTFPDCPLRANQLAHGIADTIENRKIFGDEIVDHDLNRFPACGLYHNGRMNIGNKPGTSAKLAEIIRSGKTYPAKKIRELLEGK